MHVTVCGRLVMGKVREALRRKKVTEDGARNPATLEKFYCLRFLCFIYKAWSYVTNARRRNVAVSGFLVAPQVGYVGLWRHWMHIGIGLPKVEASVLTTYS